nr:EOG090X0DK6 [Ilyocryptus agilis]
MGERKGVNKYYPPDYRPEMGSINKYHGTHALRERANKLHLGILIIRFEMPYNIWCDGCCSKKDAKPIPIGMGNLDYVIVSGARRQERRWDPTENEQVVPEEKGVTQKLATDAMYKLEHGEKDVNKSKTAAPIIERLQDFRDRWKDDYSSNRLLRDRFRTAKKELKEKALVDAKLLAKSSLAIKLLPQSEEDAKIASLLRLTPTQTPEERQQEVRQMIDSRPLFGSSPLDESTQKSSNIAQNNLRIKSAGAALTRRDLGVTLSKVKKEDFVNNDDVQLPGTSGISSVSKLPGLCDYASSSSDDSH